MTGVGVVVLADRAADDDARLAVDARQHGVEDLAADVVEVDVDAFRAVRLQAVLDRAGLVVDAGVEAELLDDPLALRRAAGDADDAAALDLRELADGLADRAGRARDDDRLAGLRLADVEQAEVAGHAGHAEHVEPLRRRADAQVDLGELAAVDLALGRSVAYSCTPSAPLT